MRAHHQGAAHQLQQRAVLRRSIGAVRSDAKSSALRDFPMHHKTSARTDVADNQGPTTANRCLHCVLANPLETTNNPRVPLSLCHSLPFLSSRRQKELAKNAREMRASGTILFSSQQGTKEQRSLTHSTSEHWLGTRLPQQGEFYVCARICTRMRSTTRPVNWKRPGAPLQVSLTRTCNANPALAFQRSAPRAGSATTWRRG